MIRGDSIIEWLDDTRQRDGRCTVSEFMIEYAAKMDKDGQLIFNGDEHMYIRDGLGWTSLFKIARVNFFSVSWINIKSDHASINVDALALLPIFDPSISKKGFHGELLHKYNVLDPSNVEELDKDAYMHIINDDFSIYTFEKISMSKSNIQEEPSRGYDIFTKSKFFNSNGFHMYGETQRPKENILFK